MPNIIAITSSHVTFFQFLFLNLPGYVQLFKANWGYSTNTKQLQLKHIRHIVIILIIHIIWTDVSATQHHHHQQQQHHHHHHHHRHHHHLVGDRWQHCEGGETSCTVTRTRSDRRIRYHRSLTAHCLYLHFVFVFVFVVLYVVVHS